MSNIDTNALFNIGYGLYVLTAHEKGKDNGCIINTVMQVILLIVTCRNLLYQNFLKHIHI